MGFTHRTGTGSCTGGSDVTELTSFGSGFKAVVPQAVSRAIMMTQVWTVFSGGKPFLL
jgi:hypothetical protein